MKAVTRIYHFSTLILFVYGHTPTFRNEATHPLKAPTESTLGLQDESIGRTKSNINKVAVLTGGKHFEYMLLNDSNILLTSLQNDGPLETATDQPREAKVSKNASSGIQSADITRNTQTQLPFASITSAQISPRIEVPTRIVGKTNFIANDKNNSVNTNFNVAQVALEKDQQSYKFHSSSNISSTTKLYSKQTNHSEASFASFTSPAVTKSIDFSKHQLSSHQRQSYDYDDSFTKLLILNGILKPDNQTSKPDLRPLVKSANEKSTSNLTIEDINRIMDSSIASLIHNNSDLKSTPAYGNKFSPSRTTKSKLKMEIQTENLPTNIKPNYPSTMEPNTNSSRSKFNNLPQSAITNHFSVFLNHPFSRKAVPTETHTFNRLKDDPTYTDLSNKNPLATNSFMDTTTYFQVAQSIVKTSPFIEAANVIHGESLIDDIAAIPKFNELNSVHEIEKKNGKNTIKNNSQEFLPFLKNFISSLFTSIKKHDYMQLNISRDSHEKTDNIDTKQKEFKLILESYTLINTTRILEDKYKPNKYAQLPNILRLDPDFLHQVKRKPASFNWTNLSDGKHLNIDRFVSDLFDETGYPQWFILPLSENSRVPSSGENEFIKYLTSDQALKLVLRYEEVKISAIIVIPQPLIVMYNTSLPAENVTIKVNDQLKTDWENISQKTELKELSHFNLTQMQIADKMYNVLELFSLKSDRLIPENSVRIVTKHDDIELYIYIILGAICTFTTFSLISYAIYHVIQKHLDTTRLPFRVPAIFRDKYNFHEKLPESDSLNVIFSENFDRNYSTSSWLDNSQHSSSILKASSDIPACIFNTENNKEEKLSPYSDIVRNPVLNSPRLNKENKLNMLGCRSSCVLLPHSRTYLNDSEKNVLYIDNPNYDHDAR